MSDHARPVSGAEGIRLSEPLRILAVTPYYAPEGGGLERYAHQTLRRFAERGHAVQVMTFTREGLGDQELDGVYVDRRPPRWAAGNTPIDPGFFGDVREAIDRLDPDVVVAHTPVPFPAEMAFLAARLQDVPFVTTYHAGRLEGSSPLLDGLAALDRATLQKAMIAGSDELVAVSPFVREHVFDGHADRARVIPPGVDGQLFSPDGPPQGDTVLFVGPVSRSYRWKGLDVLCKAFEIVQASMPEARLEIVGTGDRTDEVQRWGDAVGGVELLGHVTDHKLVAAYRRASVVVLPSTSPAESFGMVLAEANACGRPVIGSRVGGIPSIVKDGVNGLLARPGDAVDLAGKLVDLLGDPARAQRMGEQGRKLVLRDHDWEALVDQTETVLADAARRAT